MSGRGGFRGGGRGGAGAGNTGMGRGRNDLVTTGPPVTYPERNVVQTPLLITSELADLIERSHRYDRRLRKSVFCLEQPAPKQDIERYSDRYLRQAQKPNIRSLIQGDAWDAFPEELKPPTKSKTISNGGSGVKRAHAADKGTGKKPKVAISDLLSSLEKVETQGPDGMDDEPKDVEKDENDDDDDDKDPNADAEQDDEEDMDDYIEDYAGDDYDALGSESGGDDY